jgi:hypothetical protein
LPECKKFEKKEKRKKKNIHQEDAKMIKVLQYVFKTLMYICIWYIWYNVILIFNLISFFLNFKILQNVPSFWVKNMTKICWKNNSRYNMENPFDVHFY